MFDDRGSCARTGFIFIVILSEEQTNMSTESLRKLARRGRYAPHWFWEIVIAATLLPPLVHAVATSLGASPAMAAPAPAAVQPARPAAAPAAGLLAPGPGVFDRDEPLEVELYADLKALCRDPDHKKCTDLPATLAYSEDGVDKSVQVALRTRGRFRSTTGGCDLPALFVFFGADTAGSLFEGEKMLPLTTHCRRAGQYEEYVVKEYLAYRIYNLLAEKSLRVRLARVTYHDASSHAEPLVRYAFFTEHFDSLARREDAAVFKPERFDLLAADATEIATLDLFEYMIGNTDWSAVFRHNVVLIRDAAGRTTAVPYDFDFSGLVDAEYATVAPQLPIHDVKQRIFRGVCRPDTDWERVFASFGAKRDAIEALLAAQDLERGAREQARRYLAGFYDVLESPARREREILDTCRRRS
jgi:hypothetical protein